MTRIMRLTLFKLKDPAAIEEAVNMYSTLTQDAKKDGQPYIQLSTANMTHSDARSQGYTLLARTVFASKDDMDFYDTHDKAHNAIKAYIKPKLEEPPLVVYSDMQ